MVNVIKKQLVLLLLFMGGVTLSGCDGPLFISVSPDLHTTILASEETELTFTARVRPGVPNDYYYWSATTFNAEGEEINKTGIGGDFEKYQVTLPEGEYAYMEVTCHSYYFFLPVPDGLPPGVSPPPPSKNGEITWVIKPELEIQNGVLLGSAVIAHTNDLDDLEGVTSVAGSLVVNDIDFDVSAVVSNISELQGGLIIKNNSELEYITGLGIDPGITALSTLWIEDNESLLDLSGLESLASVSGRVEIIGNDSLASVTELESLGVVGGDLRVLYNQSLCDSNADALLDQVESDGGVGGNALAINEDC